MMGEADQMARALRSHLKVEVMGIRDSIRSSRGHEPTEEEIVNVFLSMRREVTALLVPYVLSLEPAGETVP